MTRNSLNEQRKISLKGVLEIPVYYEDTDFSGSVYHAQYLKFFERAREELFSQDLLLKLLGEFSLQFVVREIKIKYLKAAQFAQRLLIDTEVLVSHSPTMLFFQKAYLKPAVQHRNAQRSDLEPTSHPQELTLLTEAEITVVSINKDFRPRRLNKEVMELFFSRA